MSDDTYNGWSNRATWAMSLDLNNDETTYYGCETYARGAAVGNEDDPEAFYAELADELEKYARMLVAVFPFMLPDFDPAMHESSDPKDPHGPDDIDEVNWLELAEGYVLSEYV